MKQAKKLTPFMEKMYARELKSYSVKVGRTPTIGELKAIRGKYEKKTEALIAGRDWVLADV